MFDKKHTIIVFSFCALCLSVTIFSFQMKLSSKQYSRPNEQLQQGNTENFFKNILFYKLRESQPEFSLMARELNHDSFNKRIIFIEPKGTVLGSTHQDVYNYSGERGFYNEATGFLRLLDKVVLYDENSELKAEIVEYTRSDEHLEAHDMVFTRSYNPKTKDWMRIESDHLKSWLGLKKGTYWGNVKGKIIRQRAYEEGVSFSSDRLNSDLQASHVDLNGNVTIRKNEVFASSLAGEMFLENYNKKLKYFVLTDDVKLREKVRLNTGEVVERRAFAEKLEGVMSESKYILTGYPKVFQQDDVIKGNKVVLRENNEIVEVDDANTNFILR